MRPVLQQAKDQGIVVISHEAPALENLVDYDVEAFDNASFGRGFGAALGEAMGGEGKFAAMVGGMTMETHMAWYEAAIEYIEANYPEMEMVSSQPYEDQNDDAKSRSLAIEILNAHPDLSGFLGFSVSAGANMAAVLQERGKEDVAVSTLGIPSVTLPYVEAGYVDFAQCWRPADAGYVSAMVALKVLQDGEVADGADLGRGGYESVKVDGTMIYGDAPLVLEPGMFPEGEYPF
jgi:simple sugar transport system substrate-binding protein